MVNAHVPIVDTHTNVYRSCAIKLSPTEIAPFFPLSNMVVSPINILVVFVVKFLLGGFTNGFSIWYKGPVTAIQCCNLLSALHHAVVTDCCNI